AVLGEAGNRVDLEHPGPTLVIETQIDPRQTLGADGPRRATAGVDERRNGGPALRELEAVLRGRILVFRGVVEEFAGGRDLNEGQRLVVAERQRPFGPRDSLLE